MPIKVTIIPPNNTPEENQRIYDETIAILKRINRRINNDRIRKIIEAEREKEDAEIKAKKEIRNAKRREKRNAQKEETLSEKNEEKTT